MWFDSWSDVLRILAVGPAAYVLLVLVLRVSGKRTLAKLNAFDLVVTVALGSTLATIFLSKDVSWSEGAAALAVLAALQFVVAAATAFLPSGRSVVTAKPTKLLHNGEMLDTALRRQRVTSTEVRQAVRASGIGDVTAVAAVVLESDGTLSVIARNKLGDGSALDDLDNVTEPASRRDP
jgi:uncharacterized membrane protein YcaP (DUF421 family)